MRPLERSIEIELRRETAQRLLLELHSEGDYDGLLAAAELLNELFINQLTISRWLAHEAADNLNTSLEITKVPTS
jgi:hypothetical protein